MMKNLIISLLIISSTLVYAIDDGIEKKSDGIENYKDGIEYSGPNINYKIIRATTGKTPKGKEVIINSGASVGSVITGGDAKDVSIINVIDEPVTVIDNSR